MPKKVTFKSVSSVCHKERFFAYDDWRDRLFVPLATFLVWVFVRLGWSGNAISLLSAVFSVTGAVLIASDEPFVVLIGSFGYMIFYLLDYVDGGVARYNKKSGIGGQYFDWIMHVVSSVAIATGLFIGALNATGGWIVIFGILTVLASALMLDRYAFAWFSVCMYRQQNQVKGCEDKSVVLDYKPRKDSIVYRGFRYLALGLFHENYAIFLLPIFATIHYFFTSELIDFRVILILIGGLVYFPVMLYEVWKLNADGKVDNAYQKIFIDKSMPNLPNDHFLK